MLLLVIYLAFISLGLPDSLLGSAWPSIYQEIRVPLSYSGIIFMMISAMTILSSLNCDRVVRKFSTAKVCAFSVLLTMMALFGFSFSHSFIELCCWAIPYGLGAGSIDAALNNYVALHYASRHMSWLHCMWGVGASIGPYIMSLALLESGSWQTGYRSVAFIQLFLTIVMFISLPLWTKDGSVSQDQENVAIRLKDVLKIRGVKQIILSFFAYCGIEQTVGLWAASFLVSCKGIDVIRAASYAAYYFLGITIGRAISGFLTYKLDDKAMVRLGELIIGLGLILLIQPWNDDLVLLSLIIIGLGSAPIYPSMIHASPMIFGKEKSRSIIGVQVAGAYVGNILLPPLFGLIADHLSLAFFPLYLLILLSLLIVMHERLYR